MSTRATVLSMGMIVMLALPRQASAQTSAGPAIGVDFSYSTDADDTDVVRVGANGDWHYVGPEEYQGFRLERVWFRPSGQTRKVEERLYLRAAGSISGWKYNATVGTDGDTVLGSAAIHNEADVRQEYFFEREKVETPLGVSRGIYYSFGGGAVDLPFDERTQLTLLGGLQKFTGSNVRTHLRANLIHSIDPGSGLSVQLRTRYFRNTHPAEYDYFSPRAFTQVLPVIQIRRFSGGWRYLAAVGLGAQRHTGSDWQASRLINLRVTSPATSKGWSVTGDLLYNSTPVTNADGYHYLRLNLGLNRAF